MIRAVFATERGTAQYLAASLNVVADLCFHSSADFSSDLMTVSTFSN